MLDLGQLVGELVQHRVIPTFHLGPQGFLLEGFPVGFQVGTLREDILSGRVSLEKAVMDFEKDIILDALRRTNYVQTHAATLLGISRRMLKYRMDTLGISRPETVPAIPDPPSMTQE